ncbi:MAG: radical SAM protein [Proteobacteria bacterium]|nr:radical SAM protein [Pseudomonadota bacterium]
MTHLSTDTSYTALRLSIQQGKRISDEDILFLYHHATMAQLSQLATTVKKRYHSSDCATYLIMAIINYTNICVAKCDYCAFYRLPHQKDTYLLSFEEICQKINALTALGGTMVAFNGGFHPKLKLQDYAELFHKLHQKYPHLGFYEMTVAEFMFACKRSKTPYSDGAQMLKEAGSIWITGGGAEVLTESFRKRHSPGKFTCKDYYNAQRALLNAQLGSTATMVIGFDETTEERFQHLKDLRTFQDSLEHKLHSFLCWTYKPDNTAFGGKEIDNEEYLKWMAICRIYLDNFVHIRTSVLTQNKDALKALLYGANDFDLPTEDEVTEKAGAEISTDFQNILNYAKHLGFTLKHRKPWLPQPLRG